MRRGMLLSVALLVAVSCTQAIAGANPHNKIAIHVVPHGVACKSLPTFSNCSQIVTTYASLGDLDVIPVFFGLDSTTVVEFGLTWPDAWGSIAYVRCAGDLSIGTITYSGEGMATVWRTCQRAWAVPHGYGWLAASSPGWVAPTPNPATGDYGVVDCGYFGWDPQHDDPEAVFRSGIGGPVGADPCDATFQPIDLAKTDDAGGYCVYLGDTLTYGITYANSRNSADVHNVTLTDRMPRETIFLSSTSGGVYDQGTHTVTWPLGTLSPGAGGSVGVVTSVNVNTTMTIGNTCTITGDETPPNAAAKPTDVCGNVFAPLNLTKASDVIGDCVNQAGRITYSIMYDNRSNMRDVHNITLVDSLPAQTTFVSAPGGTYDPNARTVTWRPGSLAPGAYGSKDVTVSVDAPRGATLTNICWIATDETPPNRAAVTVQVYDPALILTKTDGLGGQCVNHGANLTYSIAYENMHVGENLQGVVLKDNLPSGVAFVSASSEGTYDPSTRAVTWSIGTLAGGASGSEQVTVWVTANRGTILANRAEFTCQELSAKSASITTRVCGQYQRNTYFKVAIHVKSHDVECESVPAFQYCTQISTTYQGCGEVDVVPVFFGLAEYSVVEFAVDWPQEWGSCTFTRCKGDIAVGNIVHSGDGIAIAWIDCQYAIIVAPGFVSLHATTPGLISPHSNPATGELDVVNCAPSPGPYVDYPVAVIRAGVCGATGEVPCSTTRVQPSTWGQIKAQFK
ncbi:MAG: hypothetical protein V1694_00830 [Candidatus Eisenbacteria bacterium]